MVADEKIDDKNAFWKIIQEFFPCNLWFRNEIGLVPSDGYPIILDPRACPPLSVKCFPVFRSPDFSMTSSQTLRQNDWNSIIRRQRYCGQICECE